MKIIIVDWSGRCDRKRLPLPYKEVSNLPQELPNDEALAKALEIAERAFKANHHVALIQGQDSIIIGIDRGPGAFSQR